MLCPWIAGLLLAPIGATAGTPETDAWFFPSPNPPSVHLAKGLWWDFFGLSEAMSELGGAPFTSSYLGHGRGGPSLRNFPASSQAFQAYNLIVLANVDAPAVGKAGLSLLDAYVRNGGALLVTGGPFAFERGGYTNTPLEGLLPCDMVGTDRVKSADGLVIQPAEGAKGVLPEDLAWALAPRVYFHHEVRVRPGATILARAGDKPLLVVWQVGKGRVAVLAASAEGEPGPGQLAFWEWGDMPRLTASVCRWLVAGQGSNAPAALTAETKALLDDLLKPTLGDDAAKQEALIRSLLSRCHDKAFARDLLEAVANVDGTPDRAVVTALARGVQPFADASFEPQAKRLIQTGNAGLAALGLQVLGMCRGKEALATILPFLEQGSAALKPAGKSGAGGLDDLMAMNSGNDLGQDQRLKLAATIALGHLGDPANLDALKRITALYMRKPQADLAMVGDELDLEENLLQQSLASRARLGDGTAVGPFLDLVLRNGSQIESFLNCLDIMLPDPTMEQMQKMARVRLPALRQRQDLCMDMLRRLPVSVYPDLVAAVAKRSDDALVPYATAALARRPGEPLPPQAATALLLLAEKSRNPALRQLALVLAESAGGADAKRQIADLLGRLGTAPESADRLFALRRATRMLPADRARAIAAGLQDADPRIKRLAQAMQKGE
jgi:uncharacterized membrane protein